MSGGPYGRGKAPERAVIPLHLWPQRDREIWTAALAAADPFADQGGERAGMRLKSNQRLQSSYGRWLTFLDRAGRLSSYLEPAKRIRKDTLESYVRELQALGNLPSTIALRLTDLLLMARLFDPAAEWTWIARLAKKVAAFAYKPKNKRLGLPGSHELYALGLKLMVDAENQHGVARVASQFRDGLMIALLALVPLRRKNFVQLRIGVELKKLESNYVVEISGETTKTHTPVEFDWPVDLKEPLETYLQIHRPVLAARSYRWLNKANDQLWIALSGSALTQMAFYDIVTKRTKTEFGIAINPHAFRHAAATTLAVHDPEHVRVAAAILGHRSLSTTQNFYNQAGTLVAHRRYTEALSRIRQLSRRPDP